MTQTNLNHGGKVLSATITNGQVVVFDRPAKMAGAPGTVTAKESAGWTDQDWKRWAQGRQQALRRRQHASNLLGPRSRMSPEYAQQVARQQRSREPQWTTERVGSAEIDVRYGSTLVETWRSEQVPDMGRVWACYPAGHALPVGYSSTPPDKHGRVA